MTREERKTQLRALLDTEAGRKQIVEWYLEARGSDAKTSGAFGMLYGQMIETILDHEFGN